MRIELLKEIIHSLIGDKSKGVAELLFDKENVNEFIIAKKLNLTINQTRNLLYRLLDEGLVSVVRKKNRKKGGWYDHFWKLDLEKTLLKFKEVLNHKITNLRQTIASRKSARFYFCESCNIELNEEQALLQEYVCTECGQLLALKDTAKDVAVLEKELVRHERDLQEAEQEISIIVAKDNKSKERRMKSEERKKAKERELKRKANQRKKAREKAKNKKAKKPSKK